MEGFGVHTFRLVNADGRHHAGEVPLEAAASASTPWSGRRRRCSPASTRTSTAATSPTPSRRARYPQWELGVQIFPDTAEQMFEGIDLLDPTKLVPEELAPVQAIGTMTLDANPTNYFAETEQVAFHAGHLVPGIDVTDDPLLQGAAVLLPRHPDHPARRPQLHAAARSTVRTPPSTTCCATASTRRGARRRRAVPPQLARRRLPVPAGAGEGAFIEVPAAVRRGREGARAARRRSTTTSARPGCSGASMTPRRAGAHRRRPTPSSSARCYEQAIKERQLRGTGQHRRRPVPRGRGGTRAAGPGRRPSRLADVTPSRGALADRRAPGPLDGARGRVRGRTPTAT